jgi:hypothetical protein
VGKMTKPGRHLYLDGSLIASAGLPIDEEELARLVKAGASEEGPQPYDPFEAREGGALGNNEQARKPTASTPDMRKRQRPAEDKAERPKADKGGGEGG